MKTTIRDIIEHPNDFNPDDFVIVIGSSKSQSTNTKGKKAVKKKRRHFKCQFELRGKWKANGKNETIPFSEYEKLKRITGLTAEDVSISYQVDHVWFVTSSQKTLDKVNANYHTAFSFEPFEAKQNSIPRAYVYED